MAEAPRKLKYREVADVRADLLKKQGGLCAICTIKIEEEGKVPCLDHDHDYGHIRGVLCGNCNSMEGKITNCANRAKRGLSYIEWIHRMVAYLDHHSISRTNLIHPRHKEKHATGNSRPAIRVRAARSSRKRMGN